MSYIQVGKPRPHVSVITMNRPEAKNAINGDLANGLWAAVEELNTDPMLTAGVLTGADGAFCSGMDLKAFAKGEDIGPIQKFFANGADKPLVAAIEAKMLMKNNSSPKRRIEESFRQMLTISDEIVDKCLNFEVN